MKNHKVIKLTYRELEEYDSGEFIIPLLFEDNESAEKVLSMIKDHFDLTKSFRLYHNKDKISAKLDSIKKEVKWLITDAEAVSYSLMSLHSEGEGEDGLYIKSKNEVLETMKNNKSQYEEGYWIDFIKLNDSKNNDVILLSDWCQYGNIMEKMEIIELPESLIKEVEDEKNIADFFGVKTDFPVYLTIKI